MKELEKWKIKIENIIEKYINATCKESLQVPRSISRVEVIDRKGRSYVNRNIIENIELSIQDDNRTLKIIIYDKEPKYSAVFDFSKKSKQVC